MSDWEKFKEIVSFLTEKKGIMQQHIADEIKVDRTAFNHAVRGARITKCNEYSEKIKFTYAELLKDMGIETPIGHTTQKQAWELVLEKQEEILRGINQILGNQKNAEK